ncbi:MAG: iron ABC transporter permease [Burkholderiales bacterium]|jgi:iron complex transport system permease protein|nr:iron ABC transporter permease [Burkholderiales bacterium]
MRLNASLIALLGLAIVASLAVGRFPVSFSDVVGALIPSYAEGDDVARQIVETLRLPRVLLAALCGIALGLAGAAMQGVFRNPLVGPELCGVSSGAALGGVIAILINLPGAAAYGFAFVTGLLALVGVFLLAQVLGRGSLLSLVLIGVIISSFLSACIGVIQILADPAKELPTMVYWLMGSFSGATWSEVGVVAVIVLIAGGALLALRWRINLLSLDDTDARALGVSVTTLRWVVIGWVAALVAAQVSVGGGIGWVGLIVPHAARLMVGAEHGRLLPTSAWLGGIYLVIIDDVARGVSDQEIPIGLLTAILGAPIFALILWKATK